jgi:hypothetical protein
MKLSPHAYDHSIEVMRRMRTMCDDIDAVLAGLPPSVEKLSQAPLIHQWKVVPYQSVCLAGFVSGHPRIRNGPVLSSQVFMLDPERKWGRTISRFYRLGTPAEEGGQ